MYLRAIRSTQQTYSGSQRFFAGFSGHPCCVSIGYDAQVCFLEPFRGSCFLLEPPRHDPRPKPPSASFEPTVRLILTFAQDFHSVARRWHTRLYATAGHKPSKWSIQGARPPSRSLSGMSSKRIHHDRTGVPWPARGDAVLLPALWSHVAALCIKPSESSPNTR